MTKEQVRNSIIKLDVDEVIKKNLYKKIHNIKKYFGLSEI